MRAFVPAVAALALLASCGDSATADAGPGPDAGRRDASIDSGSDASTMADGGSDAGLDGGPPIDAGPPPDCASYCALIIPNCISADTQYASRDDCMAACAALEPGTLADASGNTLGC